MAVTLKTPQEVLLDIASRFKARRLALNLSQEGLATRSGVSLGSLKRFEHTGQIALGALLKIALPLDCLGDFDQLAHEDFSATKGKTLDEILSQPQRKLRKKGRIK